MEAGKAIGVGEHGKPFHRLQEGVSDPPSGIRVGLGLRRRGGSCSIRSCASMCRSLSVLGVTGLVTLREGKESGKVAEMRALSGRGVDHRARLLRSFEGDFPKRVSYTRSRSATFS